MLLAFSLALLVPLSFLPLIWVVVLCLRLCFCLLCVALLASPFWDALFSSLLLPRSRLVRHVWYKTSMSPSFVDIFVCVFHSLRVTRHMYVWVESTIAQKEEGRNGITKQKRRGITTTQCRWKKDTTNKGEVEQQHHPGKRGRNAAPPRGEGRPHQPKGGRTQPQHQLKGGGT